MANVPQEFNTFYLKDVSFVNLMTRRIFNVLIVANPYDAFMLEDDGRVDEKIFDEYTELGMRFPPIFTQVSTIEEARHVLDETSIDLVICMPGTADNDAFTVAREVKAIQPSVPCVVLTPFSHGITKRMQNEDMTIFDYVFCWLGNTNLILSIIKLIEDKMNIEHDIEEAGVQMILLVEDNIRFYSSVLPNLYNYILQQSKNFSTEALNPHAAAQRKRGRPKVVLATNYEEALQIYEKYAENTLGVISDTRFPMQTPIGRLSHVEEGDPEAGLKLLRTIRQHDEYVPLILESSEVENREKAWAEGFDFLDKNSKKFNVDLRKMIEEHLGFGDFVFRDPETHEEVARVKTLKELQDNIFKIPHDSLMHHIRRNHMSRWLCARAIFPVSQFLKQVTWHKLQDVDAHRQIIFDAIVQYRRMKNIGVVAVFDRLKFDRYAHFARIGEGSLGGKGRGLAFLDNIIKRHPELNQFGNATVQIPKTVVLCTDFFDRFMDDNNLWSIALSDAPDEVILQHFLKAQLPDDLIEDFFIFFDAIKTPIAIRSSSLLEDSHYQPFAGIYSTYMIPWLDDKYEMLRMLACAIKSVYASVYYRDSKAYMTATQNVIDQEKMAVILQEVVGHRYGDLYYPTFSGVLRSLNYYPIGDETAEEGIASLALGLGKYIVDGGQTLRVSPYHPNQVLQTSEMETALRDTQTRFYALDMSHVGDDFKVDDGFNIKNLRVRQADADGSLTFIASTYDPMDQVIRDGIYEGGRKIISFCGVLQQGVFPLPELLQMSQKLGAEEMRRPVEIEFACNLNDDRTGEFYLLQIRPIVDSKQVLDEDLQQIPDEQCLLRSHNSLGHGISEDVTDVVYVKTDENFTAANNPMIADEIERINRKFLNEDKNYILIGPGRWGSSDYWLGIPVKWPHISGARVIVEAGLKNYHVDPSQGTHFFQNLTSFGVGYFTINTYTGDGVLQKEILDSMPAVEETEHVRHVRFERPLKVMMDGKKQTGVVLLPQEGTEEPA
ncbi:PEP/pyruvate-binding domain-containing protein [Prevotella communis]|uniref:Pyruvate phosphate dikinase, PEP/pyruvate binding domain n=1 Tax=Prevotella communis TaxID=2913614 RepID=A0A1G7S7L6_9BACT|nr:PEP/pyruvate-binding domain-containing protein [Prevotella communis]UKK56403.1 phosphoenolpyruvate synthase [Prevotella communis]UKK61931.1 phosphoenolpyruvate synthase [Prevotella communis]UKK64758.1 phosphoenolpyruvate synthase [Prevotella communis]UKK67126.1 phosphoenolpyruvate synthase [Prevotella communis]UKK70735.1 phosphoenolpyruvate synthase [Prevotella communis]